MMVFNEGERNRTVASTKMNTNRYTQSVLPCSLILILYR